MVLRHVEGDEPSKVTLVLPQRPDFDLIVAAYLVQELLDTGSLPPETRQIVEYIQAMQAGLLPSEPAVWHTPYGVLLGIRGRNMHYCREHALSQTQQDLYDIQRTFYFVQYLLERLTAGVEIMPHDGHPGPTLFDEFGPLQPPFERERDFVRRDLTLYERDVARAGTFETELPVAGQRGVLRRVTAIALDDPTSTLFATWAHQDIQHTARGFDLVVVHERDQHYSLSVKPTAGVWLKGLDLALERAEATRRHHTSADDFGLMTRATPAPTQVWENRDVPASTSIASSGQGSTLSLAEVLQLVQQAARWMP
jgi:hypothetical protein